jgi:hypothetical protein
MLFGKITYIGQYYIKIGAWRVHHPVNNEKKLNAVGWYCCCTLDPFLHYFV